jgi:hypothetical protein
MIRAQCQANDKTETIKEQYTMLSIQLERTGNLKIVLVSVKAVDILILIFTVRGF